MKRVSIVLAILGLIGAAGAVYYYFIREPHDMPTCDAGFRLDFMTRTCVPFGTGPGDTEPNIDFAQHDVTVPETSLRIRLKQEGSTSKYSGAFEDPNDPIMRGFLSIDSSQAVRMGDDYVLVPLFVTYGGTGQFLNVALFDARNQEHIGSVFVGDRIGISSIDVDGQVAKVNYRTRLESEGYAAEPTIPAQLVVEVKDRGIKEIMRLQNADYDDVELKSPAANSNVSGEFAIRGSIPGNWYFEAIAQYEILSEQYEQIAFGPVQALSDWMTTQRVPFEVKVNASTFNYGGRATIIISSDNIQGDEEGERKVKKMEIPVVIR